MHRLQTEGWNLVDYRGVFDAGDDPQRPAAGQTGLHVDARCFRPRAIKAGGNGRLRNCCCLELPVRLAALVWSADAGVTCRGRPESA
jgi:hypothetical protein